MTIFRVFFLLLLIPSIILPAFAIVDDFITDKSLYHQGDQLRISGTVSYDSEIPFVTIQIFTPGKSNFADFNMIPVNSDGNFSAAFSVGGPTWTSDGIYPIKITYDGNLEKSIKYQELSKSAPLEPTDESTDEPQTNIPKNPESVFTFNTLKLTILNFSAFDKSPQYYIDIYNNKSSYKSWFDSQFPNNLIYNVLGYENPMSVPDWIRNNTEWWATGKINDSAFVSGIEFMLENNIIMVSATLSENISNDDIPDWIRNTAHWRS